MDLQGKVALVTGATSGIGFGIANKLAMSGADVVINGFGDDAVITQCCEQLKQHGNKVLYSSADVSKPGQIEEMVNIITAEFGAIDILVNNAGIQYVAPVDEFPPDKWNDIIAINLSAAFHTIRLLSPAMKKKRWGRIINIASVHGLVASAYKAAYVAAKHGLVGLTKVVALDLAEYGISCNAICPGYVNTPLVQKQIPAQAKTHGISEQEVVTEIFLKNHAIKQFVEIDDLADMVLFLCSDPARTITGSALPIDAGWSAQ